MIKIIHYFWFGGNPEPEQVKKCFDSWKEYCPDYEIKRWDENNFNVDMNEFTRQAYKSRKWAFVSDFARFYTLYEEGGICLDTDVELIKPLDDLLNESFAGFESNDYVAPGLILYAHSKHEAVFKEVLDYYNSIEYSEIGENSITSPQIFTNILKKHGLVTNNKFQIINGINIYPMEYFQPWGTDWTKKDQFTGNTRSIHHYDGSWMNNIERDYYNLRYTYGQKKGKLLFAIKHPLNALKKFLNKR